MSHSVPAPLDVFNSHKAILVSELENPVEFVADCCREADIIDLKFHEELVLVSDKRHKAEKLVNAVCDRIEAQPAQVEQEQCVLRRFIGALRRESSCEQVAIKLEKSLSREYIAECTEDYLPPRDSLNNNISKNHRRKIGRHLSYWKKWANALNLTGGQISGIDDDKSLDYEMKGEKVLELWAKGYNATYRVLCTVALKLGDREIAFKVCEMVNGDWNSICSTDVSSGGDRFPVQSTGVETIPFQPTTDAWGPERQVVSGLRQRRMVTPALLTDIISRLYDAQSQSYSDQSIISRLENECSDLQRKLQMAMEELELAKERIKDKEKELRELFYQKHMLERNMNSQVEGMESRVEDLKATSVQNNEELREKISQCEQEKQSLLNELKDHESKQESLMKQISELTKKVDNLVREKKGWFSYAKLMHGKMNSTMCSFFAMNICTMVCIGVFIILLLVIFYAPSSCYHNYV